MGGCIDWQVSQLATRMKSHENTLQSAVHMSSNKWADETRRVNAGGSDTQTVGSKSLTNI